MPDQNRPAIKLQVDGLPVQTTADLFRQVVEDPEVVVSGEQMDVHPLVDQLGQLANFRWQASRSFSAIIFTTRNSYSII